MAVTKIWPIKDSIKRVVEYAKNAEKTELCDIKTVLHYAANGEKVVPENEKTIYVTGVNCSRDRAFEQMFAVQERFGKTDGNVAYHAYQSFKTGEVSPELCHRIGVELAQKMWGDKYQVLVATHFNTGTYHNHFVVNAVGMWDGKKYDCNKGEYFKMRALSDELCRENNLFVIKNPHGKTARSIYFAEKKGEPTKFNLMREAIDYAVSISVGYRDFVKIMKNQGYEVDLDRKYPTIKSVNSQKAVRMFRLGAEYEPKRVFDRIREGDEREKSKLNRSYWNEAMYTKRRGTVRYRCAGTIRNTRKLTGLKAQYFAYCYRIGLLPKNKKRSPLSPEMKEAWRWIDCVSKEVRLMSSENLNSLDDVKDFIESANSNIEAVTKRRNKIYSKLRRCDDSDMISELKSQRNECTLQLKNLRNDVKTAESILSRNTKMKEEMRIETKMKLNEVGKIKDKTRKRGYER